MKTTAIMVLIAACLGILMAYSMSCWYTSVDRGVLEIKKDKEELLRCADLFKRHHKICEKVGMKAWKEVVRPEFMSRITWATIRETGNVLPNSKEVINWVKEHPIEAVRLLEEAGKMGEK